MAGDVKHRPGAETPDSAAAARFRFTLSRRAGGAWRGAAAKQNTDDAMDDRVGVGRGALRRARTSVARRPSSFPATRRAAAF